MKKYNIGLDIGTTSVGWAVVEDGTQNIIRKGNKALWGVRLFEEARTAEERRNYRSTRRRYDRRRNRIKLLQNEFLSEINKVDTTFFTKMQESKYHEKDNKNKTIKLTNGEREQIKNYYEKYPTIYHLRDRLINDPSKEDIRLVYLAIHHMIKYRGNFLYGNSSFNVNNLNLAENLYQVFDSFQNHISLLEIPDNYKDIIDFNQFAKILLNPSKNDIKVGIKELLSDLCDKKFITELSKALVGNKFNVAKLFMIENPETKVEINFNGNDFDDKYADIEQLLGDKVEALQELKNLYDTVFLKRLFNGSDHVSLSSLMVSRYEHHQKDLKLLKEIFRPNKKLRKKLLKTNGKEECLYDNYISNHMTQEEFSKELIKLISLLIDQSEEKDQKYFELFTEDVKKRIENGDFLPRITDAENGKFPYQLNKDELIKIIENQGKYYPFLLDKTKDESYKIVKLLEFKIPYYVGPLVSDTKSSFAWMERKVDNVKITPYNFDEVIDKEKTAEKFIKRMISHCTYLLDEYALPNNSIYYSRYKVLNELKQIRVNDQKLSNEQQQYIIKELFEKTNGTITQAKFLKFLNSWHEMDMYNGEFNIRGYSSDNKFANNLQSYYDFFGPDGIFENTKYNEEQADKIIEWITIFDDKDILEHKLRREFPDLSDQQIKKILSKKYSGWGSLSKELLSTKYYKDKETNISKSIMDLMNETDENFMQIINNDKYQFQKMIQEKNSKKSINTLNYQVVEPLTTSPSTKRGIYQALKIVKEIVEYMGYEPVRIMIEMARGEEKKQRKDDRKKYLEKIYDDCKTEIENYKTLRDELKEHEINTQKLFLYFIQEGKCLYSGRSLNIEDLDSYEIDHIIPRTLIKDDSIDNKALVYRECNQKKAASYVLPLEYRNEVNKRWWARLKKLGLISAKKFHNLSRRNYSDEDIQGFINRQLVETRQITKHVANILNNYYKKTKVVYLKANLSHNYRERYDLFKFREINDYHHAHDAYLAAVLGEYKEKYMKKDINFQMVKEMNDRFRKLNQFKKLKYGYVINSLDEEASDIVNDISKNLVDDESGEILFDAHKFNQKIENTLYRNDILVSKKTEVRTGMFYNQTKQKKGLKGLALKGNMPSSLYGSYTSIKPAYAVMVMFKKRGKENKRLVGVPIYYVNQPKEQLYQYLKNLLKINKDDHCEIISRPLPFYSYLKWDNQICYLVGASDTVEVCNAKEFHYDKPFYIKYKYALHQLFHCPKQKLDEREYNESLNKIIRYIIEKISTEYVLYQNLVSDLKRMSQYDDLDVNSTEKKEQIIKELTKLLNCNSENANFKFLDKSYSSAFGKKNGRIVIQGIVINKSVTGIKERQYEF